MKKESNSRGVIMFAHNNTEIDYFRLAVVNALLVQKNLGIKNITVVTDPFSLAQGEKTLGKRLIKKAINNIIVIEKDKKFKALNQRLYKDTSHTAKYLPFYNVNRCDAYDLSPYDETILIDVDYLILSDTLNGCWGHNNELMMNWKYQDIMYERKDPSLARLNDMGITMYWATVVYFRKTEYVESFFNVVSHVKKNPQFYKDLYKWQGTLYRNDYSFSIAAHVMSGFVDKGIPQLPTTLYKSFDTDDIHSAVDKNTIVMYLEKPRSPGDFMLTKWQGIDLHIMNKWAINRVSEELLEYAK
tara:strand:- start:5367 stop:6266 length:900 start_codon:yes stop_codon:yes gene_type:complete